MADDEGREEDEWLYGESVGSDIDLKVGDPQPVPPPSVTATETTLDPVISVRPKATKRKLGDDEEGDGNGDESGPEGVEGGDEEVTGTGEGQDVGTGDEEDGGDKEGLSGGEDISDNEDDDDDSEDDGVQVVIGDLKGGQGNASGSAFGSTAPPKRAGPPPDKKGKFASEDFDATGTINGVPAQDFSLDSLEDKPWRKPGADITDYFNYGFTEDTWRAYCDRQKRLRYESGATYSAISSKGTPGNTVDSKSGIVFPKKFTPQGGMKDGMGRGQMGMRREEPRENTIQVRVVMTADRREYGRKNFDMNMGPPMIPPPPFNMNLPPPPFPPPPDFMGPEFFNHPPPGYYQDEEPGYDDQQWMDSQWEMGGDASGLGPSPSVVPLTKVAVVPPPPGESTDEEMDLPPKKEPSEK